MKKYFEVTTSDKAILKRDILRQLIYRQAETLFMGQHACVVQGIEALDIKFNIPKAVYFTANKIAQGAKGPKSILEFFDVSSSMDKYETGFVVTHEVKARQLEKNQINLSIDRCARGIAYSADVEIFDTLKTAKGDTTAAAQTWDNTAADPAGDIATAIGKMLDSTTILDTDISKIGVYFPAKQWGHLVKPQEIDNIRTNIKSWAERELQIVFHPTRQLTTQALVVLKSEETAFHLYYDGPAIPLSFFETDSVGDQYTFHRYFKTVIIPDAENGTTTNRIQEITGVAA